MAKLKDFSVKIRANAMPSFQGEEKSNNNIAMPFISKVLFFGRAQSKASVSHL